MPLADQEDFPDENGGSYTPSASEGGVVSTVARAGGQVATVVRRMTLQSIRLLVCGRLHLTGEEGSCGVTNGVTGSSLNFRPLFSSAVQVF